MKVLILSYSDIEGGAARGALRLHKGLQRIGVDSRMLVMSRKSDDHTVIAPRSAYKMALSMLGPYIDALPVVYLYRPSLKPKWSTNWFPNNIYPFIEESKPDIVHLRWVGGGFLNLSVLPKIKKPIVWTMPDTWAFTGGCHYPGDCEKYMQACGACPQLESSREHDLSRCIYNKKARAYKSIRSLTVVGPSRWMAECAGKSSLLKDFRIEVIPNGIDHNLFRPIDKTLARQMLGLPEDKKLILFGAVAATSDRIKGFQLLVSALGKVSGKLRDAEVVVFGASEPKKVPEVGLGMRYMGYIHDDLSLALLYSAADVMVVPSKQDNFPLTAFEATACGTPVVAFEATGVPDIVEHERTGYLAKPFEREDLARGIEWVLGDNGRRAELSRNARWKVEEEFTLEICARRYVDLYRDILSRN